MEIASIAVVETEHRTYWPMARAANADLLVVSMPRVNLLLTGPDHLTRAALQRLVPCLHGPIEMWSPGAPLILPAPEECGTLILRDVDALSTFEQYRLLKWLELPNLRSRVISTTSAQLRPRADAGSFDASLYFRLNVACVDLMA